MKAFMAAQGASGTTGNLGHPVAQICNLLYRRIAFGRAPTKPMLDETYPTLSALRFRTVSSLGNQAESNQIKPNQTGENHRTCFNSAFRTPRSEFRPLRPIPGYSGYFYKNKRSAIPSKSDQIQVNPGKCRYFYRGERTRLRPCPPSLPAPAPFPSKSVKVNPSKSSQTRTRGNRSQCLNAPFYRADRSALQLFNPLTPQPPSP